MKNAVGRAHGWQMNRKRRGLECPRLVCVCIHRLQRNGHSLDQNVSHCARHIMPPLCQIYEHYSQTIGRCQKLTGAA